MNKYRFERADCGYDYETCIDGGDNLIGDLQILVHICAANAYYSGAWCYQECTGTGVEYAACTEALTAEITNCLG